MAQIQEVITDTLGNTITLIYDEETNKVTVNNTQIGPDFVQVNYTPFTDDNGFHDVIILEDYDMVDWEENWSDNNTRWKVSDFYHNNVVK